MTELNEKMIAHVNRKQWWHVLPRDSKAYAKRGIFYASSFRDGLFWGRPLDSFFKARIANPLVGDENRIHKRLLGNSLRLPVRMSLKWRHDLDARYRRAALHLGYDSIVLLARPAYKKFRRTGRIPREIELNVLIRGISSGW